MSDKKRKQGAFSIDGNEAKGKKVMVSINDKYEAIRRSDASESPQNVAVSLGVGRSTIVGWGKK